MDCIYIMLLFFLIFILLIIMNNNWKHYTVNPNKECYNDKTSYKINKKNKHTPRIRSMTSISIFAQDKFCKAHSWRVMAERLRAPDSSSGVWSAECGFESRSWHLLRKIGEVVLSALPARLRTDDTQAYIRMDCKRGNPVSALGVGGNGLWKKIIVAHTLKWPSGLVCLATCIK